MKGGATQRMKISTWQGTTATKLGGRAGVAKARRGALRQTRRKAGERRYGPQVSNVTQASLKNTSRGPLARPTRGAALDDHGNRLTTVAGSGGVLTAARSEGVHRNMVKALVIPRRKTSEQGRRRQRRRRSQGSRWVRLSDEPSVTRWDAAKSRRRPGASPDEQEDPAGRGTARKVRHGG